MDHIAILDRDMLGAILVRRKTIESRWSQRRIPPYECLTINDTIYLKLSGGQVLGQANVKDFQHFENLTSKDIADIVKAYGQALYVTQRSLRQYWNHTRKYGTLIWLDKIKELEKPFSISKAGFPCSSGWLPLPDGIDAVKRPA